MNSNGINSSSNTKISLHSSPSPFQTPPQSPSHSSLYTTPNQSPSHSPHSYSTPNQSPSRSPSHSPSYISPSYISPSYHSPSLSISYTSHSLSTSKNQLDNYKNKCFSPQQIKAIDECTNSYMEENYRYVMLNAEMQSGKTDIFIATGCLLYYYGFIDKIVIFSGNTEVAMKKQHEDQFERLNIFTKLNVLLNIKEEHSIYEKLRNFIQHNIDVIWGCDIDKRIKTKKNKIPLNRTLYVWDESHYAQSITNRPYKLLNYIGISASCDDDDINEKMSNYENYFMSVTATGMSEYIDKYRFDQKKKVIIAKPGDGYIGVKQLLKNKRICKYDYKNYSTYIEKLILKCPLNKYIIIRTRGDISKTKEIIDICNNSGANTIVYDQTFNERNNINEDIVTDIPTQKTVIIVKGLLTMGQRLNKENIYAVMETSKSSKTDTLLQGLIGRICGYYTNIIKVYIPDTISKEEFYNFIKMYYSTDIICPSKAMNVISSGSKEKTKKSYISLIPIKLHRTVGIKETASLVCDILAQLNDGSSNNSNNEFITITFINLLNTYINTSNSNIKIIKFNICADTYKDEIQNVINASTINKLPYHSSCKGCGCGTSGKQFNIWVSNNSSNIYITGDIHITDIIKYNPNYTENIQQIQILQLPTTNKTEVFTSNEIENTLKTTDNNDQNIKISILELNNENTEIQSVKQPAIMNKNNYTSIIPIEINNERSINDNKNNKNYYVNIVKNTIQNNTSLNYNNDTITRILINYLNDTTTKFTLHNLSKKTYCKELPKILKSIKNKELFHSSSSCGKYENQIIIWYLEDDLNIYVTANINNNYI